MLVCVGLSPTLIQAQPLADSLTVSSVPDSSKTIERQNSGSIGKKSPRGAMIRSIVLPGWGQFYNGKWFKGILVAGTEIGLVVNAMIQNDFANKAQDRLEHDFYIDNRNLSYWWLAAVILYSMTDAYVDAHLYDFDESTSLSFDVRTSRGGSAQESSRGLLLSLSFDF
jgi:hypothetical protein